MNHVKGVNWQLFHELLIAAAPDRSSVPFENRAAHWNCSVRLR